MPQGTLSRRGLLYLLPAPAARMPRVVEAQDSTSRSDGQRLPGLTEIDRLRRIPIEEGLERASYSAVDYVNALRLRRALVDEAARAFTACDLFAAPTDRSLPARLNASRAAVSSYAGPNTFYASMTGIPALAIPCGFTTGPPSLPVSLMLHARPFDEALLFRVAGVFQRETDWHMRQPPLQRASP